MTLERTLSMAYLPRWVDALNMLSTLLPSFLADLLRSDHKRTYRIHSTSYLDGLRGIASLLVFFCHYTENHHAYLTPSYGLRWDDDKTPSSLIQLPFLRIIFSGRPMVHIFFVISGFVLSCKPLKALHARNSEQCYTALASSVFRRPIRLFGPCIVSTFIIMILIQTGWMYDPMESWSAQIRAWMNTLFHSITWSWQWDQDLRPGYDVHLWTIPIEFAHSMLLFTVILFLSRVRVVIRQAILAMLLVYCLSCGKWAAFEFLGGMFLAEIHLLSAPGKASEANEEYHPARRGVNGFIWTALHVCIILFFLFVGGWPNMGARNTPGIRYLFKITPGPWADTKDVLARQKFWFAISALLAEWSCGEVVFVRRFLEGPVAQYLGRISYAVYICHGPVLDVLGERVVGHSYGYPKSMSNTHDFIPKSTGFGVKGIFGDSTPTQRTTSWFFALFILAPLCIWVADLFWRLVDIPMINMAKRLENACLDQTLEPDSRGDSGYCLA